MRKCLIRNDFLDNEVINLCGENLLKDIIPIIIDKDDNPIYDIEFCESAITENINFLADKPDFSGYVNIKTDYCKIIYDLNEVKDIDRIMICGYFDGKENHSITHYNIFISDDMTNIFDKTNCVVEYDNTNLFTPDKLRNHCDQVFDLTDYPGRYFALEIIKPNETYENLKISYIGLYNHIYTNQINFCKNNFQNSIIQGKTPTIKGCFIKDLSPLTDGICFDESTRIYFNADSDLTYKLEEEKYISSFYIIGSYSAIENCILFSATDKDALDSDDSLIEVEIIPKPTSSEGSSAALYTLHEPIKAKYIRFCFKENDFLDEIGIIEADIEE